MPLSRTFIYKGQKIRYTQGEKYLTRGCGPRRRTTAWSRYPGACSATPCLDGVEKLRRRRGGQRERGQLSFPHDPAIRQSQDLYLRNHRHDALHLAGLPLHRGGDWIYRPLALIGASGSFVWALFGSVFCKFFSRHTKAVNLVMALLLVY